jgi:ElaB/YqjD/DUF883 family membrane-anchored ribosome-binding protein
MTVLIIAVFVGSCAKPPTEEMLRAEKSLESARMRGADLYAADEVETAEAKFELAKKLVASRLYDEARAVAAEVEGMAHQAVTLAGMRKEELKVEVDQMIDDLREELGELRLQTEGLSGRKTAERRRKNLERLAAWEAEIKAVESDTAAGNLSELRERLGVLSDEIRGSAKDFISNSQKARRKP